MKTVRRCLFRVPIRGSPETPSECVCLCHTVDGRNPANKVVDSLSHYSQGFIHPRWLAGFLPSTVCKESGLSSLDTTLYWLGGYLQGSR